MKTNFALVDRRRQLPEPGLSGRCQVCSAAMIAKCGEIRIWHWAHHGKRRCDPWWENQTAWHRNWKDQFPPEWQEIVHRAKNGEKHIADVKTARGWVIEFQHSYLTPAERRSREAFHRFMVWVVDGLRRKRDKSGFKTALREAVRLRKEPLTLLVPSDGCTILREWAGSRVLVFFDFGEANLWCLDPKDRDGWVLLTSVQRAGLIKVFHADPKEIHIDVRARESAPMRTPPSAGFDLLVTRQRRARQRKRFSDRQ